MPCIARRRRPEFELRGECSSQEAQQRRRRQRRHPGADNRIVDRKQHQAMQERTDDRVKDLFLCPVPHGRNAPAVRRKDKLLCRANAQGFVPGQRSTMWNLEQRDDSRKGEAHHCPVTLFARIASARGTPPAREKVPARCTALR
jgi:hypothetical protein